MKPSLGWVTWASLGLLAVFASFAAGAVAAHRATRPVVLPSVSPSPGLDARSVALARLLMLSLRQGGADALTSLPRATPEDERDLSSVREKVVQIDGEIRDVRFDDGFFVGTITSRSAGVAYFITPIAVDGMTRGRELRFHGVPIDIGAGAQGGPSVVVVGAFDER